MVTGVSLLGKETATISKMAPLPPNVVSYAFFFVCLFIQGVYLDEISHHGIFLTNVVRYRGEWKDQISILRYK